jgi:SAM-dependent methyltransferase
MSMHTEQAAIEVRIDWEQNTVHHRVRQHFGKFNFWRDILPGALAVKLPESSGEWVSDSFAAGELVAPWSASNIHTVKRSELRLARKNGPSIELHVGRHYPRYIAAGTADIYAGNVQPLRVIGLDADSVTIDLNHPLARCPLVVAARIVSHTGAAEEHGGRCNDVVEDVLAAGAGLETLHAPGETDFFSGEPFARLDARSDQLFYSEPRLLQHLDATAIEQIRELYGRELQPGMQVLDLMSSWVSHLPDIEGLTVTGLGMNAGELAANPQLAARLIHDLNEDPRLPFPDNHFDAAVCSVSIEYLTRPVEVLRELGRILKPGSPAMVTFSDRWFPTKAIALWGDLHPFERMALVLEYFRQAANFTRLATETVRGLPRPETDKYADQRSVSDPVYSVCGYAAAQSD